MRQLFCSVVVLVLGLSLLGCEVADRAPSTSESAPGSGAPTVTADPLAPTTPADQSEAVAALEAMLRERGDDPESLGITRAANPDEIIPLQWWSDHDRGKPYKVIELWAKNGYQGHMNWHFLLWRVSDDAPWELVSEGKS